MSIVQKIKTFTSDVVKEMKKVSWPTKEQLKESTGVVIITTIIFTIFIFLIDKVMEFIVRIIYGLNT